MRKFLHTKSLSNALLSALFAIFLAFSLSGCGNGEGDYDFSLNSERGKVGLKDFAGKKIVYFGYTLCPDVCPATLSLLGAELKALESEAQLLFISLDPLRDGDLSATNEWLRYFYPHATALIATDERELAAVAQKFGVIFEKVAMPDSAMRYSVAHSNEVFLFDEGGELVGVINDFSQNSLHSALAEFLGK